MSEITLEEIAKNHEDSTLRNVFPEAVKVLTQEDATRRIESLEEISRILLERVSQLDGKRVIQSISPQGYVLKLMDAKTHERET